MNLLRQNTPKNKILKNIWRKKLNTFGNELAAIRRTRAKFRGLCKKNGADMGCARNFER